MKRSLKKFLTAALCLSVIGGTPATGTETAEADATNAPNNQKRTAKIAADWFARHLTK